MNDESRTTGSNDLTRRDDLLDAHHSSLINHCSPRVILWDIDGTLVRSHRPGEFTRYFAPALEQIFGTSGRLNELTVSGMTDLQITHESLREHGHTHDSIRSRLDDMRDVFMREMERVVREHDPFFYALNGARAALEATARSGRYLNSLLTGNIHAAAYLKLRLTGLDEFFTLPGAFGDDSHDRRELPAIAHARLEAQLGVTLQPSQLIVVGDTPNDILCARHHGCRAIAVATGRSYPAELLRTHAPDALLPDLSNTKLLIETLDELCADGGIRSDPQKAVKP